ncbi:hypothetical protein Tco_1158569, partial [Tanacetum coccineum]
MNDKQEVKKADGQEIENVKDEEGKNVKGSLDANEEIIKAHTRVHELEKHVEKLPMELQSKNNFREALETTSKDLKKKMLDLKPMLHDLQKVVVPFSFLLTSSIMAKKDIDLYHSRLTQDDLNDLIIKYKIPRDLHPRLPLEEFVMSKLSDDAIAIDDPRPAAGSFSMADVRRLSAHVIKLRDMPGG